MGLPNLSRETKISGANADRHIFIFPVQLTTGRIGNLTRLIHTTLAICVTVHTYIHSIPDTKYFFFWAVSKRAVSEKHQPVNVPSESMFEVTLPLEFVWT